MCVPVCVYVWGGATRNRSLIITLCTFNHISDPRNFVSFALKEPNFLCFGVVRFCGSYIEKFHGVLEQVLAKVNEVLPPESDGAHMSLFVY